MSALDKDYWSNRYNKGETGWDIGGISTPLKAYFDQLPHKTIRILLPGAGNAYEAEYLVKNGFDKVFVCDIAAQPLQNLKQRCPLLKEENLLLADFFELNTPPFDLIIEQTFFCAINPALRPAYFKKMHSLLKPGGKLVGVLFNEPLNTDAPPFGGSEKEYPVYFNKLFKVHTYAPCYNSIKPREGRELFINLVALAKPLT